MSSGGYGSFGLGLIVAKNLVAGVAALSAATTNNSARARWSPNIGTLGLGALIAIGVVSTADAAWVYGYGYGYGYPAGVWQDERMYWQSRPPVRKKVRRAPVEQPDKQQKQTKKELPSKPITGPLLIAVSIADQRVRVYDAGVQIAEGPVSTGVPGHPTPTGVFSVIQKDRWHRSNIYSGAPMPYMQRITWSGVALHAGVLPGHPASHGCIRMTTDFAIRLWNMTKMGARVLVTQKPIALVDVSHSWLVALKKKPADPAPAIAEAVPSTTGTGAAQAASATDGARSSADAMAGSTALPPTIGGLTPGNTTDAQKNIELAKNDEAKMPSPGVVPSATDAPPAALVPAKPLRPGPITVFVSKKEGKLFVRKGFEPLFSTPVKIANPERPLGTHVYTAAELNNDKQRWIAVSLPSEPRAETRIEYVRGKSGRYERKQTAVVRDTRPATSATEALGRVEAPPEALDRISDLLSPGATLIISDQGLGSETGKETDFIVLTR